jgi:O-antigen/teichoic acid export membrane protein
MGQARVVAKNTGVLVLVEVARKALGLFLFMAVARLLGVANFGILAFALAFTELLGLINKFGFEPFILREIARCPEKTPSYWANMAVIKIFLAILYLAVVVVLAHILGVRDLKLTVVYICSVDTIFQNFVLYNCAFFRAHQKAEYEAITRLTLSLLYWLLGWGIIIMGYGLVELAVVLATVKILSFCISLYLLHRKISPLRLQLDPAVVKEVLKGALPFVFLALAILFQGRVGVVILSLLKGDVATGMYAAAMRLWMAFSFIPVGFMGGFLPAMSKLASETAGEQFGRAFRYSFKYLLIVGLPLAVGATVLPHQIIGLLYGSKFAAAAGVLRVVMWALLITFLNYTFSFVLIAVNREKTLSTLIGISAGVSLVSNLVLVPFLSAMGSAVSLLLTQTFVFGASLFEARRHLKVDLQPFDTLFKPVLSGLFLGGGLLLLQGRNVFFILPAAAVIYLFSLVVIQTFNREERHLLRDLTRKFSRA